MEKAMDDAFLTHNWGSGGINHAKVSRINKQLKELGLKTWFDEEKLSGNIRQGLADAISNSNCFVVFITKEYELKVNSNNPEDSCYYEFNFASSNGKLTSKKMVAVVLEASMKDPWKWSGRLSAELGTHLYVDFSGAFEVTGSEVFDPTNFQTQCVTLFERINKVVNNDYSHIQEITDGSNRYHDRKYPWIKPFFEGIEDTYEDIISRKFDQLINIISIEPGLNDELVTYNYHDILIQILKLPEPTPVLKSFLNLLPEGRNDLVSKILQSIMDLLLDEIHLKALKAVIYQCDIHKLLKFLFNKHFTKVAVVEKELSTLLIRFAHHIVRIDARGPIAPSNIISENHSRPHFHPLSENDPRAFLAKNSFENQARQAADAAATARSNMENHAREAVVTSIMEKYGGSCILMKCYLDRYFTCFSNNLQELIDMNTLRIPELLQLCSPEIFKATKYYSSLKLSELKAWYSCSDLYEIFSLKELKDAGFSLTHLMDSGIFKPSEMKEVGFTAREFLETRQFKFRSKRFSLRDLNDDFGFSLIELKQGGATDKELKSAQFSLESFLSYPEAGFNLFEAGFKLDDVISITKGKQSLVFLKTVGYPPAVLFTAGFTVRELYHEAKFSVGEIVASQIENFHHNGYEHRYSLIPLYAILSNRDSLHLLRPHIKSSQFQSFLERTRVLFQPLLELSIPLATLAANFHPANFKENNVNCSQLDFSLDELFTGGYSLQDLFYSKRFQQDSIEFFGGSYFSLQVLRDLRQERNCSAKEFRDLGFKPYLSLFTLQELKESGYDVKELYTALDGTRTEPSKIAQKLIECGFSLNDVSQLNTSGWHQSSTDYRIALQYCRNHFVIPVKELKSHDLMIDSQYYKSLYLENELRESGGYSIQDFAKLKSGWSVYQAGFRINEMIANGFTDESRLYSVRQLIEDKEYLLKELKIKVQPEELIPYFSFQEIAEIIPDSYRYYTVQRLIKERAIVAANFVPYESYVHSILPNYVPSIDFSTLNYEDPVEKYFLNKYLRDKNFYLKKFLFASRKLKFRQVMEIFNLSLEKMFDLGFKNLCELKEEGFNFKEVLSAKKFKVCNILETYCPVPDTATFHDDASKRVYFRNILETEFRLSLNDLKFPCSRPKDLRYCGFSWKEIYDKGNYPVSEFIDSQFRVKDAFSELEISLEEFFKSLDRQPQSTRKLVPRDFKEANIPIEALANYPHYFQGKEFLRSGYSAKEIIPLCIDTKTRIWKDIHIRFHFNYSSSFSVAEMIEYNQGKSFSLSEWQTMGYIIEDHVQRLKDVAGYTITDIIQFEQNRNGNQYHADFSAGFSVQDYIDEGFNIKKFGNFKIKNLKNQGKYNLTDFLEFGYSLEDLAKAGFSLKDFRTDLKIPILALRDLVDPSYSNKNFHFELMENFPEISNLVWKTKYLFSSEDFKKVGVTISTLITEHVYSYEDLRFEKAYTSEEYLIAVGENYELLKTEIHFSLSEYVSTGLSPQLAYEHTDCALYELFNAFKTRIGEILSLADSGYFVIEDLIAAHIRRFIPFQEDEDYYCRFTIKQLRQMGFNVKNLYPYGDEIEDYRDSGFTPEELYIGGFTRREIVALYPEFTLESLFL
jgi:hypothetical protein